MNLIELEIKIEFRSKAVGMRDILYSDKAFMIFGLRMDVNITGLGPVFFTKLSRVQDQVKIFCQRHKIIEYTDVWSLREV